MNRIGVTGATGQIGLHVLAALRAADFAVLPIDRAALAGRNLTRHLADAGVVALVHLAGGGVHPSRRDADSLWQDNVLLTATVTKACIAAGVTSLISFGSGAEYAPSTGKLDENATLVADNAYGLTKAAAGLAGLALCQGSGTRFHHVRLFGFFGRNEMPHRLLPTLVAAAQTGRAAQLSAGTQIRDWLSGEEIGEAVIAMLRTCLARSLSSGIYNLGSGAGHSVRDFVRYTLKALHAPSGLAEFGALSMRDGEGDSLVADISKIEAATGWSPALSLEASIARELATSADVKIDRMTRHDG